MELHKLTTEKRNPNTMQIDRMSTLEMVRCINREDQTVALAVEKELENIARAVDGIAERLAEGGRLIYCGAGTSGRLGILDASECPPTYGVDYSMVMGLIAGGTTAIFKAKENAEDSEALCEADLKEINFSGKDVLCALAASGRTPYCIGGLKYAASLGALTISVCCNENAAMAAYAEIPISPVTGPEVVTGSTRMKAGTAQKMVCNMLTTATMIKLGKVYGNLMVDMRPTNAKLVDRAKRIVMEATGASYEQAEAMLQETGNDVKLAVFMLVSGLKKEEAESKLKAHKGYIAKALEG